MDLQRTAAEQQKAAASSSDGPATRTQAATKQQQLAAADMAWPLLLQHDSIRTQLPVACKLLCCSKALAAAVAEHSAGQLDMPSTAEKTQQAAPWLRKHARLVRSLTLHRPNLMYTPSTLNACVAALMLAGPQSLMLQSLKVTASNATLPLLEQLPVSRLTHLGLWMNDCVVQPQHQPAFVARLSAALGRLTALRNLELSRCGGADAAPLSGLSALTQLTALSLDGPVSDLQHVPPQLLELDASWTDDEAQLDLRHLAAVTALSLLDVPVKEGNQLPPNLLRLRIADCRSVRPLLPLVQLQQLDVRLPDNDDTDITADQLRQLSRLTALSLGYDYCMEPASTGAWPLLPLQQLELTEVNLSAPVCQHLAQLPGLTSLVLDRCQPTGSAEHLAAALQQLSGLQRLGLLEMPDSEADEQAEMHTPGLRQLVQAIGSLQRLRELRCSWLAELAEAASGTKSSSLTALTALTALSLSSCDLTDAAVTAIVSQLPGLQSLDCGWNERLTNAALPAIERLQQLTALVLANTRVTDAGLHQLAQLTRLKKLDLFCAGVTDAGLRHLTCLTRLQELCVPRNVTQQRRRWLQQQLPRLARFWSCADTGHVVPGWLDN